MRRKGYALWAKGMQYLRTPPEIWAKLKSEFPFTLDACASDANHLLDKYYTQDDSCLDHSWHGEVVYCHPMYDDIPKFVRKAANEQCTTVMLLPAATHTKYFHRYIYDLERGEYRPGVQVEFLKLPPNGFRFGKDDGSPDDLTRRGYIKGLMIVVFRNTEETMKRRKRLSMLDEMKKARKVEAALRG